MVFSLAPIWAFYLSPHQQSASSPVGVGLSPYEYVQPRHPNKHQYTLLKSWVKRKHRPVIVVDYLSMEIIPVIKLNLRFEEVNSFNFITLLDRWIVEDSKKKNVKQNQTWSNEQALQCNKNNRVRMDLRRESQHLWPPTLPRLKKTTNI